MSTIITIPMTLEEARERTKRDLAALRRQREKAARREYNDYFAELRRQQESGAWRANRPKGVKA